MRGLPELQRQFLHALRDFPGTPPALAARSARRGLAVYRNNYVEGTVKTLVADYPVIERLVGAPCFRALAQAYRHANPSRAGDLQPFGAAFPGFLAERFRETAHAYLADVARLERAIADCLCEPLLPAMRIDALADVDLGGTTDLKFLLQPASRWLKSRWPLLAIWRANQETRDGSGVDLLAGGAHLLIQRGEDGVVLRETDPGVFLFGESLAAGAPLGLVTEQCHARYATDMAGTALACLFEWQLVHGLQTLTSNTLTRRP